MATISVRIDPELKKQMDALKHLNWSEIIRTAIKRQIKLERELNLAKAVLINEKVRKKSPEGFDSTDLIRKFREERH
jgi:Arc/MetJ-type ribon-helix-helix transcriptional regulator